MGQVAELSKFRARRDDAQASVTPSKRPQVEDGYTRIANELYQVVNNAHACPVTLTQLRIIHGVIRRTYGFNKTMDAIADTQIAADTGIPRQKVNPAKHQLIAMKVLVLSEDGRRIGINKHYDEWDFSARPEKKAPQRKPQSDGDSVTKKVTPSVTKSGTHKRQKDSNTSTNVEERIGEPNRDTSEGDKPKSESNKLPDCPHMAILDLWAEIMPDKRQHSKTMWHDSSRAQALSARWKMGFTRKHADTGKHLYTNLDEGIDWWERFFKYLRRNEFLMKDHRWFDLGWVCKRENFIKILERNYEEDAQ